VINSRSKPGEGFNISEFLKSLGQTETPSNPPGPVIPGLEGDVESSHHSKNVGEAAATASKPVVQYTQETFNQSLYTMFSTPPPPPPTSMVGNTPALEPPPVPPEIFMTDNQWDLSYEEMMEEQNTASWNTKLPTKFPTWGENDDNNWEEDSPKDWESDSGHKLSKLMEETPMSPPMFEKEGFNEPVEYDDTVGAIAEDVDHRTLITGGRAGKKDVDHRNLISLTGSPASLSKPQTPPLNNKPAWNNFDSQNKDLDFRVIGPPQSKETEPPNSATVDQDYRQHTTLTPASPSGADKGSFSDNVESVDMEMSDEENDVDNTTNSVAHKRGESNRKNSNSANQDKTKGTSQQKNSITGNANQSNGPQRISTTPSLPTQGTKPLQSPSIRPLLASVVSPPIGVQAAIPPLNNVQGTTPMQGPSPMRGPSPKQGPSPMQGPSSKQGSSPMQAPSPIRGPSPMQGPSPKQGSSPMQAPSPMRGPSPMQGPNPMRGAAPVQVPSPMRSPAPVQGPSPMRGPAPVQGPSPMRGPAPVQGPSPIRGISPKQGPSSVQRTNPGPPMIQNKVPLLPTPPIMPSILQSVQTKPEVEIQEEASEAAVADNVANNDFEPNWPEDCDFLFVERMQNQRFERQNERFEMPNERFEMPNESFEMHNEIFEMQNEGFEMQNERFEMQNESFEEEFCDQPMSKPQFQPGELNRRSRGRRGNQIGSSGHFRPSQSKPYQKEYSPRGGYPNQSPGYSARGYKGHRPFRGARRGHFPRW
jgi:hypothetical protein